MGKREVEQDGCNDDHRHAAIGRQEEEDAFLQVVVDAAPFLTAPAMVLKLSSARTMLAASFAASVPLTPIASPTLAMGVKGTEAAKEAASIVLADDNFSTIAGAVRKGAASTTTCKRHPLPLPTNGGMTMVVIAAVLFDFALPMTSKQILWINMITAVTLCLGLTFEQPRPTSWTGRRVTRKPRHCRITNMADRIRFLHPHAGGTIAVQS